MALSIELTSRLQIFILHWNTIDNMWKIFVIVLVSVIAVIGGALLFDHFLEVYFPLPQPLNLPQITSSPPTPTPTPTPVVVQPGESKSLSGIPFVYQTYNNCGPAALSMDLAYFGVDVSQQELADIIRPYNNPQGYNDDKSVTLEEFGPIAQSHGLIFYSRPNGSVDKIKLLLANNIPVITHTWLFPDDYIGHVRVMTGFDDQTQEFIQMDAIEGSRRFSYQQFLKLWQPFNYEYAVIAPPEKDGIIKAILGPETDSRVAWTNAQQRAQEEIKSNPQSLYANFNVSVTDYHLGLYQEAVQSFEKIRSKIPIKMLWYQLEPVESYLAIKDYSQVFVLTDQIFRSGDPSYSEAYITRGDAYLAQGNKEAAKTEYQKAVLYNKNLPLAKEKLAVVNN